MSAQGMHTFLEVSKVYILALVSILIMESLHAFFPDRDVHEILSRRPKVYAWAESVVYCWMAVAIFASVQYTAAIRPFIYFQF